MVNRHRHTAAKNVYTMLKDERVNTMTLYHKFVQYFIISEILILGDEIRKNRLQ